MPAPASTLLRRAFKLSGILPLGAFLVVHLVTSLRALAGQDAYLRTARVFENIPGLAVFEALFVFAPLLFHAAVGLWLVVRGIPLDARSPYPRALRVGVRVTGVLALAFLAMHLAELRFRTPGARPGGGVLLSLLDADLSSVRYGLPWRAIAYLLGTGCVCFHFAAGLWGYFAATPRGEAARARRRAAWWAGAVGATMWILFVDVAVYHATGTRLLGGSPAPDAPTAPCPPPSASATP